MKNHTDVLIFHKQICAGTSQICLMADANWIFASPRRGNAPEWGLVCQRTGDRTAGGGMRKWPSG